MAQIKVRAGDIASGQPKALEQLARAVAELETRFNNALGALDGDSGVNLTTYAATYGTAAAARIITV